MTVKSIFHKENTMDINIKQRAKDILKNDMITILSGAGIIGLMNILAESIGTDQIGMIIAGFITALASACAACFYFRAFHRGAGDVFDTYALLTDKNVFSKVTTIMMAMWIVNIVAELLMKAVLIVPIIGKAIVLLMMVVVRYVILPYLLSIVWYLFVANPQYPTAYYLKASAKYLRGYFMIYIGFTVSVNFLPYLIQVLLSMFIGSTFASILCMPLRAYVNLAMAGFFSSLIPNRWFAGVERF